MRHHTSTLEQRLEALQTSLATATEENTTQAALLAAFRTKEQTWDDSKKQLVRSIEFARWQIAVTREQKDNMEQLALLRAQTSAADLKGAVLLGIVKQVSVCESSVITTPVRFSISFFYVRV